MLDKETFDKVLAGIDKAVERIKHQRNMWSCVALEYALKESLGYNNPLVAQIVDEYGDLYKGDDRYLEIYKVDAAAHEIASFKGSCWDKRRHQDEFRMALLLNFKEYLINERAIIEKHVKIIERAAQMIETREERFTCVGLRKACHELSPIHRDIIVEGYTETFGQWNAVILQSQMNTAVEEKIGKSHYYGKEFEEEKDNLRYLMLGFFSAMTQDYTSGLYHA